MNRNAICGQTLLVRSRLPVIIGHFPEPGRGTARNTAGPKFVYLYIGGVLNMAQSLTRSKTDRMLGGVCGGIARTYGWDPTIVRILYVLLSVISAAFPGILVYVILWVLIPEEI